MTELNIITHCNQRVLTTSQLAEAYGSDSDRVNRNFNNNKHRYKEGKHFFLLEGEELKEFKMTTGKIDGSLNRINKLYLWTEKGAWLHAKSLNTDKAWDAYEMLVDEYYEAKEQAPQLDSLELALQAALTHEREIKNIKSDVSYLKDNMRVDGLQQQEIQKNAKRSVIQTLGGTESFAYQELSKKAFSSFWREFKQHFNIPRYGDLPKSKFDEAVRFVELWRPSTSLQIDINQSNSQMSIT